MTSHTKNNKLKLLLRNNNNDAIRNEDDDDLNVTVLDESIDFEISY